MSNLIIGLTVVALGSSMPDIVGACIINALLTIGLPALITPLDEDSIGFVDFFTLAGASLLLWLVPAFSKNHKIGRIFGILLVLLYAAYMTFTVIRG